MQMCLLAEICLWSPRPKSILRQVTCRLGVSWWKLASPNTHVPSCSQARLHPTFLFQLLDCKRVSFGGLLSARCFSVVLFAVVSLFTVAPKCCVVCQSARRLWHALWRKYTCWTSTVLAWVLWARKPMVMNPQCSKQGVLNRNTTCYVQITWRNVVTKSCREAVLYFPWEQGFNTHSLSVHGNL